MKEKNHFAFTLIELIVVVAIIGLIAAIAIPKYGEAIEKANLGATLGNLAAIRSAVSMYYGDNLGIPSSIDINTCPKFKEYIGGQLPLVRVRYPYLNSPYGRNVTIGYSRPTGLDNGWYFNNQNGDVFINSIANDILGYCYTIY